MTTTRHAIDPVTRIEGHLRIEIEVDSAQKQVTDAWSTGTMFRGIEQIMVGRNPLESWMMAQRACGVCTHVHALASIRASEAALKITVPDNARILRNVMHATQTIHDHVVHFYHLHLPDWVDVTKTLDADPTRTAALAAATNVGWKNVSVEWFTTVQNRLKAFVGSGQLGPFTGGYWGHPAYLCTPEESLLLYAHYLEALDFQREIVKIHAIIGGKNPHPQTYAVGGMSTTFAPDAPSGVNTANLAAMRSIVGQTTRFVEQVLLPDVVLLARRYRDRWFSVGVGPRNFLTYGDMPVPDGQGGQHLFFPRGRVVNGVLTLLPTDPDQVAETVARSWYTYQAGDATLLKPYVGETSPAYTGPTPPYQMIEPKGGDKYSWLKAPRYDGGSYEVGPLARAMVGYAAGRPDFRRVIDGFLKDVGLTSVNAMMSTMGRLASRALETGLLCAPLDEWLKELQQRQAAGDLTVAVPVPDPATWGNCQGYGVVEAPRGALGHWVVVKDKKIDTYQMVVPTTWNGSPRDAQGHRGAWEEALRGNPIVDPGKPLEILRTVHSFDPCMGCSVHVLDADGGESFTVVNTA